MKLFYLLIIFIIASPSIAQPIRPFSSDGCTLAPDGTFSRPQLWRDCCLSHDLRFWGGGTFSERKTADQKLASCIEEKSNPIISRIFMAAVTLGSYSPFKLPNKKWGNAWSNLSTYRQLSERELLLLIQELEKFDLPLAILKDYQQELQERLKHEL